MYFNIQGAFFLIQLLFFLPCLFSKKKTNRGNNKNLCEATGKTLGVVFFSQDSQGVRENLVYIDKVYSFRKAS